MVTGIDSFKEWFKGSEEQYDLMEVVILNLGESDNEADCRSPMC